MHLVQSDSMSPHQIALLEYALLVLSKMHEGGWNEIPLDLRISFAKHMQADVWTHTPDVLTLRDASLLIVRDAIARTGEFRAGSGGERGHNTPPPKAFAA